MTIKNLTFIILATFFVSCNANEEISKKDNGQKSIIKIKDEYNLQNIFAQNYDYIANITVIANKVKKTWVSKTRVKNKETILNGLHTIKVENRDIEDGKVAETEYTWYDHGVLIKYDDSNTIYEINPKTKYKTMPNNAKIGERGTYPVLHSKNGGSIRTNWSLEKENTKTLLKERIKIYSKGNIFEVIENDYTINNDGKILEFIFNYYFGDKIVHLLRVESEKIIYK